jgi:hypothetical protein
MMLFMIGLVLFLVGTIMSFSVMSSLADAKRKARQWKMTKYQHMGIERKAELLSWIAIAILCSGIMMMIYSLCQIAWRLI